MGNLLSDNNSCFFLYRGKTIVAKQCSAWCAIKSPDRDEVAIKFRLIDRVKGRVWVSWGRTHRVVIAHKFILLSSIFTVKSLQYLPIFAQSFISLYFVSLGFQCQWNLRRDVLHTWWLEEKRQIARTRNSTFIQGDKLSTAKCDKTDAIAVITKATREAEKWQLEVEKKAFLNRSRDQFQVISEKLIRARAIGMQFYRTEWKLLVIKDWLELKHLLRPNNSQVQHVSFWLYFDSLRDAINSATPTYRSRLKRTAINSPCEWLELSWESNGIQNRQQPNNWIFFQLRISHNFHLSIELNRVDWWCSRGVLPKNVLQSIDTSKSGVLASLFASTNKEALTA